MEGLLLGIVLFFDIIQFIVIVDIILSWLQAFGIPFRPKIISNILTPFYSFIKSIIPTTFGPFDFGPFIVILGCMFIKGMIFLLFPNLYSFVTL